MEYCLPVRSFARAVSDIVSPLYSTLLSPTTVAVIQVLVNPKDKQFAIRACKEDAPNAIAFSKPEHEQKYAIKISSAAVVDLIRKMGEWSEEDNWNVPGIYFADEQALVYDLGAAFRPSPRGGWTAKRQKEAAAAAALSSAEATED